jgi:hypothetical protein
VDLVHAPVEEAITIDYPFNIRRSKRTLEVESIAISKRLKKTYDKRVVMSDFSTLPYGHVSI